MRLESLAMEKEELLWSLSRGKMGEVTVGGDEGEVKYPLSQ